MAEKTETPKPRNPHRVSLAQWMADEGHEDVLSVMEAHGMDSIVPALCDEGCEVEPDGRCPHDCPSVLLVLGMI